jgi:hypothetical protein
MSRSRNVRRKPGSRAVLRWCRCEYCAPKAKQRAVERLEQRHPAKALPDPAELDGVAEAVAWALYEAELFDYDGPAYHGDDRPLRGPWRMR